MTFVLTSGIINTAPLGPLPPRTFWKLGPYSLETLESNWSSSSGSLVQASRLPTTGDTVYINNWPYDTSITDSSNVTYYITRLTEDSKEYESYAYINTDYLYVDGTGVTLGLLPNLNVVYTLYMPNGGTISGDIAAESAELNNVTIGGSVSIANLTMTGGAINSSLSGLTSLDCTGTTLGNSIDGGSITLTNCDLGSSTDLTDRKSTRLNSSHLVLPRMPSSA